MKRMSGLLAMLGFSVSLFAQDAAIKEIETAAKTTIKTDTSKKANSKGWTKGATVSLNLTQVGNSNWVAAGGDKFSLSLATSINLFASRKWGRNTWDNTLDLNYGLVKTTTLGLRKVNDRLDFVSKYGYQPKKWKNLSYSLLGQLRSQLTSGFEYDYFGTTEKRRNSGFFAPAYIIISPGIDWKPNSWFSLFASPLSTRWIIVTNGPYSYLGQGGIFNGQQETPLASLYGVDPAKEHKGEFGAFVTATVKKDLLKNVAYYSKLDLYSNYLSKPQNVDVFWTNQFKIKVHKWINISYNLDMLYDDDIKNPKSPGSAIGLQLLSTFGVGFATKF
ncbi:MAG: hypothetical protein RL172_2083 [Bacteroidota bacterium]|jgi:hypothetical protein